MVCAACCCCYVIAAIIVYKLLDKLIRLVKIGKYSDRFILVTGCDTGFGHLLAKRLDGYGCNVFAGCLMESGEVELKKSCSNRLQTFRLDVSQGDSVRKAFDFVKSKLPPGKGLWGLVNNAGIAGEGGRVEWIPKEKYQRVLDVNSLGLIDMTVVFLPLIKQAKGRVVNTASILGRYAFAMAPPYTMSKYCVEAFTDCLRRQMREYCVKSVLIEPGFFKTNITSAAHIPKIMDQIWQGLTPEQQQEFGQTYFKEATEMYSKSTEMFNDKIEMVVDAYEHALLGTFPRARYVVGWDAKLFFLPMQWLPEWLGDWLVELLFKPPVPAALK